MTPPEPSVRAAAGVIAAEMAKGHSTAVEIATAEASAGILFDPQRAEDIHQAAREQAAAEYRAELDQLQPVDVRLIGEDTAVRALVAALQQKAACSPAAYRTARHGGGTRAYLSVIVPVGGAGKDTPTSGGGSTRAAEGGER
jgi:hypothetical protein